MEMIRLQTTVDCGRSRIGGIRLEEGILVIGSCFADRIGEKLCRAGYRVLVNPFGTLYNPVSVVNAVSRLASGAEFVEADCVAVGAGAGLCCSFSHHTSFARPDRQEFLRGANAALSQAHDFYQNCRKLIITLGTSWCYKFKETGEVVANCLKIDPKCFERELLSLPNAVALLSSFLRRFPDRKFIFTVSPIRHPGDGAHGNLLGKSILILAVQAVCERFPDRAEYFPAYELMMDELRDYRFYADDLVHPSGLAVDYIWERFQDFAAAPEERERLLANEREYRRSQHRSLHFPDGE